MIIDYDYDYNDCLTMIKWNFRNETSPAFSEILSFTPNSFWKSRGGHPNLEVFLNQTEHEIFKTCEKPLGYSNLSMDDWKAVRLLSDDRNTIIKKQTKGVMCSGVGP